MRTPIYTNRFARDLRPLSLRVIFPVACDEEDSDAPLRYPAACGGEIHFLFCRFFPETKTIFVSFDYL